MRPLPLKEGLLRLFPARQPDHRDDDGRAVNTQHHKRRDLQRGGDVKREFGEPQRPDHRYEQDQSDREDNRE